MNSVIVAAIESTDDTDVLAELEVCDGRGSVSESESNEVAPVQIAVAVVAGLISNPQLKLT